jgi:trk system potassium uptake protein TrkA
MQSVLIIGLGRFGKHLSIKLAELGNEVMVVDKDEDIVSKIAPYVMRAQSGDCMEEDVLRSIGVRNFDICFVCISDDFQSSLEITLLLKELGASHVVSKADRDIHAKFLRKIGADDIIYPERDMAQKAAIKYSIKNAFDYIELTPEYAIFEILVPTKWIGKTIQALEIRSKHNINIIGIKNKTHVIPMTSAKYIFKSGEHLFIAGSKGDITKLMDKK